MLNDDLREENLKLRAENRRLCAALEKIRDTSNSGTTRCIARAALNDLLPGTHHDTAGGES